METLTESLERSLQNCSLNHDRRNNSSNIGGDGIISRSSWTSSDSDSNNNINLPNTTVSETSLELNSHLSLPYHWEQCLDLKTGEIYYINWRNGMKAREDPRTAAAEYSGDFDIGEEDEEEEEEDDDEDDDDSSYDSDESSPSSRERMLQYYSNNNHQQRVVKDKDNVLVVAGCKTCLMYVMVPKQVEDCPKCNGQLLHFDRSETSSS